MSERILKAIAVTAELTQTEFSKPSLLAMLEELKAYDEEVVLQALRKCYRELTGRLTLAQIINRIETSDGRPMADEAWGTAMQANDEANTVIWTKETQQAFFLAKPALEINDVTGARMAFKDAYTRLVHEARANNKKTEWVASLGWDVEARQGALEAAAQLGRLSANYVSGLLPPPDNKKLTTALQLVSVNGNLIGNKSLSKDEARQKIAQIKEMLAKQNGV